MPPSVPEHGPGQRPLVTELPYGPLPVRSDQPTDSRQPPSEPDRSSRRSRLDEEPGAAESSHVERGERASVPSSKLVTPAADASPARESDDDVHFGVAAKALGVSRKTVERMVKRAQLQRGPSGAPATVSKRDLVSVLEQRRRDVAQVTRTTDVERGQTGATLTTLWPQEVTAELQELLLPVLEPLLAEFVAARTRVAVLESQMKSIAERTNQERRRDELLLALATGGWRERRRARRTALRHYALREDASRRKDDETD
jgi:hypothetical protein